MNWDAIGAVGDFVGGAAVIITLMYLTVQLRQNTKTTRLSSAQAITEQLQNMFNLLSADQELAEIFAEAGAHSNLKGAEKVRYYTLCSNLYRVYESAFIQRKEGAIENERWEGLTNMFIDVSKQAAFPDYWHNRKH
jgi:hypothetical protein